MGLSEITTYANPYNPAAPFSSAYAYAAGLGLDMSNGTGQVVYNAYPSAAAANVGAVPIGQVSITLGQTLVPASGNTPAVTFPTLMQLMSDPAFAQAFGVIQAKIDAAAKLHPLLAGSTAT